MDVRETPLCVERAGGGVNAPAIADMKANRIETILPDPNDLGWITLPLIVDDIKICDYRGCGRGVVRLDGRTGEVVSMGYSDIPFGETYPDQNVVSWEDGEAGRWMELESGDFDLLVDFSCWTACCKAADLHPANAPAVAEDDELSLENAKTDWRETAAWWHRRMIPVADGMVKTPLNGRGRQWWRDQAKWHRDCLARLEAGAEGATTP